jgi:hypothetical protein
VAPLTYSGELRNCKAPVLNMTSIRKHHCKKSPGKNMGFRSFQILGCWILDPTLH